MAHPDSIYRKLFLNLQFLSTAHVGFICPDKHCILSSPDQVGKLSFLRTKDPPESTQEQHVNRNTYISPGLFCVLALLRLLTAYLDWVSPDLMRIFRMWNWLVLQKDQLMIESFSQRSFTIIKSPILTSVVIRKEKVVLPFSTGLQGGRSRAGQRSAAQIQLFAVCVQDTCV